jgi:hypothetical protein
MTALARSLWLPIVVSLAAVAVAAASTVEWQAESFARALVTFVWIIPGIAWWQSNVRRHRARKDD